MAVQLTDLVDPSTTAVLTMEMQRGVSGDLALMTQLRDELDARGIPANIAGIVHAARTAGAKVVHCTAASRADRAGQAINCRLLAATVGGDSYVVEGSPEAELMPELGPEPTDIMMPRLHGLTPFTSTSLDQVLRNMGVTTVVITGNSVNVGVLGAVLSAVDLGYQVVVPSDAVGGVPSSYADEVMANTIGLLATIPTTSELVAAWA